MAHSYRRTVAACYIGNFMQAVILNVTPILFVPLMACYDLHFEQMGRLVLINFVVQFSVDIACGRLVERWGIRPFVVGGHICAALGLIVFGLSPIIMPNHIYGGLMLGTALFSAGGGLLELLLNPIISGLPDGGATRRLNLMHSIYAFGHVVVVLLTTLMVFLLGSHRWFIIPLLWSVLPLLNAVNFMQVPLAPMVEEEHRTRVGDLLKRPFFIVCMLAMFCNGAIEISMGQWSSTFLEQAVGLPKLLGDTVGVCMFAAMMGIGRFTYGKLSDRVNLYHVMLAGAVLCGVCYVAAGFAVNPIVCVLACALCGLGVSTMWPGGVSIAAETYPLAGPTMFALVSGAGDAGSAVGPWIVGAVADRLSGGLRTGLLLAVIFAIGMFICVFFLKNRDQSEKSFAGKRQSE